MADNAGFCPQCGHRAKATRHNSRSWIDHLREYMGAGQQGELNWRMLFTDVGQSHTVDEAERIFICGTKTTTPAPWKVSAEWPHPWLYSRVLLVFAVAAALLWVCLSMFENLNALPGFIFVSSAAVPVAAMVLFIEVNAWRDISFYKVIRTFLVGGCASLVTTLLLFSVFGSGDDLFGTCMIGIVEEVGKAVIVYVVLLHTKPLRILNGLLIGACVGAGFAAFESAGYAMRYLFQGNFDVMLHVILLRGVLAPGGHVTWAAISGAAFAIAAKSMGGLNANVWTDKRFLRLFILPVALHAAWDYSPLTSIGESIYLVPILLILLVWVIVLILINMGLREAEQLPQRR